MELSKRSDPHYRADVAGNVRVALENHRDEQ